MIEHLLCASLSTRYFTQTDSFLVKNKRGNVRDANGPVHCLRKLYNLREGTYKLEAL